MLATCVSHLASYERSPTSKSKTISNHVNEADWKTKRMHNSGWKEEGDGGKVECRGKKKRSTFCRHEDLHDIAEGDFIDVPLNLTAILEQQRLNPKRNASVKLLAVNDR
ncbi:hypothetical protein Btru_015536 [Bulinus truncatus]|nr:hypothetical protein Btru_015536 [Bulinus truncatus]